MNLVELTGGERLLLHRRRHEMNQTQAAKMWRTNNWDYRMLENDHKSGTEPPVKLGEIHQHEVCFIRRRRANLARTEVAKSMGISAHWFTMMERGRIPCDRLVAFWYQA